MPVAKNWFRAGAHNEGQAVRRKTTFTPRLEQLETRAVPAVTLSLAAGVLTVNGTSANETIVLKQASGQVSVDGRRDEVCELGDQLDRGEYRGRERLGFAVGIEGSAVDEASHGE